MKLRYKGATCLGIAGALLLTATMISPKEETPAEVNQAMRAGVFAETASENVALTDGSVTAGITDVMGDILEESISVAAVSETDVNMTATAQQVDTSIYGYQNLGIANVESGNLNVRETPGTDGALVGKMTKNAACEILATEGEWYQIQSGEVSGYVKAEYIVTGEEAAAIAETLVRTVAKSSTETLNVRKEPNTESGIMTTVAKGETLEVIEVLDGWVKIAIDIDEGYVSADYVEVMTELPHAMTMTEARFGVGVSDVRIELVEYACQFVGNPYVWGGTSLTKGADCSGFVLSVFKNYGISLPRTSREQAKAGTVIDVADAKPGDLLFYSNGSTINHVAIYMGNGQVVHASSPSTGIRISNYNYKTPVKAVDVIND